MQLFLAGQKAQPVTAATVAGDGADDVEEGEVGDLLVADDQTDVVIGPTETGKAQSPFSK